MKDENEIYSELSYFVFFAKRKTSTVSFNDIYSLQAAKYIFCKLTWEIEYTKTTSKIQKSD